MALTKFLLGLESDFNEFALYKMLALSGQQFYETRSSKVYSIQV